ncbi:hypothetical protein [Bacillus solimangrovi]|uniref:Uncharacterized protein n=1 Tax=Bacillus solimangrovi TaxID=1305675 RepID=A0A1E5LCG3_9BACI|nr:hypothetical protein [Bacillus solimangrovi]OEH91763.1 hypothetical protein BFG57_17715 [Bacillus solimangrovi]
MKVKYMISIAVSVILVLVSSYELISMYLHIQNFEPEVQQFYKEQIVIFPIIGIVIGLIGIIRFYLLAKKDRK